MANDILSEYNASDIAHFKKDFTKIILAGAEIDRYYGKVQQELDFLISKFEKLVEQFNRKYKGIKIRISRKIDSFEVRIFLKTKDIKEFFAESASRIPGLKAVGRTNFNQVDIADADKFAKFLDSLLTSVYISYSDPETGTGTIGARLDSKEKMIEIIYSPAEISNENSPGFRICAFYALKNGFDSKIEVHDASTIGFSSLLSETEKREWHDRFNPRMLE